jgi:hypothetical protein
MGRKGAARAERVGLQCLNEADRSQPARFQELENQAFSEIEEILLLHSARGIDTVRNALPANYCERAARLVLANPGTVLISTGFPVNGSFETDGPIGAIALFRVLEHLEYRPVFICAPPIARLLERNYPTMVIPILDWASSLPVIEALMADLNPSLAVSVERPGVTRNGRYYNMRREDITDRTAKLDHIFRLGACPTLAFGDGGNEIGMGNIIDALARLPIIPSVTRCDELVISTVSNWGVYGVIAAMSRILGNDLFERFDPAQIAEYLVSNGSVDGLTSRPDRSEDGFPIDVGLSVIARLRSGLIKGINVRTLEVPPPPHSAAGG